MNAYDSMVAQKLNALKSKRDVIVLAIETSCDETAAAVVKNGRQVLSSIVYSQIPIHQKYGGVVPEIASRNHVQKLTPTVEQALADAGLTFSDIDAVAVTAYPGLVGALLTGVSYAKGLAYSLSLPLIGVDHIMGHVAANYLSHEELAPPFTALVASGGHSHIFAVNDYLDFELLGSTRDDAAGEAFDKIARVLGLAYPGGPELEKLAAKGDPGAFVFPMGFNSGKGLDFSFSGLKTAVINILHTAKQRGELINEADIAASFQAAVVSVLTQKAIMAVKQQNSRVLALAGGVSANKTLVSSLENAAREAGISFVCPEWKYCGDNAAMIGCAGYYSLLAGQADGLDLNATARRDRSR
ncbi:tRNA (adenosine(37)-N6)-threonylcarbamoyltransferase complex transferase subunit TsaD [Eubacteriales bacterium OttesenSCG-928-K08]|nr:tRNA (adenosine(37)-N6)-threonylcarbamoyltransferase complex transferase subunit TsaD [Eubacteriales bacterium OttesenSCG-928-K08]